MKKSLGSLLCLAALAGCGDSMTMMPTPQTYTVKSGASIQAAVDKMRDGDTVVVEPGTYKESVDIPKDRKLKNITLRGQVTGGQRAILEGESQRQNGFFIAGVDGLTMEGFQVQNYKENGIWVGQSQRTVFRDLVVKKAGKYGVFPQECAGVTIEKCDVTEVADAALYVGQSTAPISITDNVVYGNVAGIECENSVDCVITRNNTHDNTGGILIFTLPHLVRKDNKGAQVFANTIENNNGMNFANPNDIVAKIPTGTGVIIFGADDVSIHDNMIRGNNSYAVALISLTQITGSEMIDVEPNPDNVRITNNTMADNGTKGFSFGSIMLPGSDFVYDGSGSGNCQASNGTTMPRWGLIPLDTCK